MGIVVYPYTLFPGEVENKYEVNKRSGMIALNGFRGFWYIY